jgi:hypothetical protein
MACSGKALLFYFYFLRHKPRTKSFNSIWVKNCGDLSSLSGEESTSSFAVDSELHEDSTSSNWAGGAGIGSSGPCGIGLIADDRFGYLIPNLFFCCAPTHCTSKINSHRSDFVVDARPSVYQTAWMSVDTSVSVLQRTCYTRHVELTLCPDPQM